AAARVLDPVHRHHAAAAGRKRPQCEPRALRPRTARGDRTGARGARTCGRARAPARMGERGGKPRAEDPGARRGGGRRAAPGVRPQRAARGPQGATARIDCRRPAAIQLLQIQSLMQIVTLGLNHTTAPVALREKVAFTGEIVGDALRDLSRSVRSLAPESAILSTCNRTEIYCATQAPDELGPALSEWLAVRQGMPGATIESHLYALPGDAAVRHAFRVASDRKSTRLNSSHVKISYAVFCLK